MKLTCIFCNGTKCERCTFKGTVLYAIHDGDLMSWWATLKGGAVVKQFVSRDVFVEKTGLTEYAARL